MEKYAVETDTPDTTKTSGDRTRCPKDGKLLDTGCTPPKCPECGYEGQQGGSDGR